MEVKKQVHTIKEATKSAIQSKSSATKFLKDAGIVRTHTSTPTKSSGAKKR